MKTKVSSKGVQKTARHKNEAKADAEASFDNTGAGNAPVPNHQGEEHMKEKEPAAAQTRQGVEPERELIPLDAIVFDEASYPRDRVNTKAVKTYAAAMAKGAQLPDIDVYRDGESFVLADGRHRVEAARNLGLSSIRARVYSGTREDAALHAVASCAAGSVRRTQADKRRAVMILLRNPAWSKWNDSEIARRCNVSADLVKTVRAECGIGADDREPDDGGVQKVRRNGKEYDQKRKAAAKPLPAHVSAINDMRELAHSAYASVIGDNPGLADRFQNMDSELHEILGTVTGAACRIHDLPVPINVYHHTLEGGIKATPEFEKKGLATHAVNVGLGCGHQCTYCSSPSMRCRFTDYGELMLSPYGRGYAVIDPKTDERILKDMPKLGAGDTVMLST
ncbi:MAG: ParB/RepB/Spo0J family partition protein, partial [Lentisphaeria bacterium]|nr:ParB/RepB/Spo0J family partition protein [Lentisphaeria bacterium]